ncbi:hypothetical protein OG339_15045 [Streptosporangium sp. NBC_01495]|uniref:hypothetical protein n=1 Tax=Streptosporangium sp. NBC_01495 TaxID=2903899 RepID=UPI002E37D8E9|nr:hypothetical protein [Streptosporangium sp. NBC_01495]
MPKRHHVVTMSLLGLFLGASTACGSGGPTVTDAAPAVPAWASDLTRSPGPGQSAGPGASTAPGTGPAGSAVPVPDGFKQIGGPANGVVVAVPKDWVALDLTKDDLDKGLRNSGLSGPTLEQAKKSLQTLVDNNGLWASDADSAKTSMNGFPTNLNAFCQAGRQISTEQLLRDTRKQLEQLNAKVIEARKVRIGSREAARIVYSFATNGVDVRGTQYYVPAGNKTCIVTLSTDAEGKQELFDRIGETITTV